MKVTFISAFLFTEKSFELKRSFSISLANLCGNLCCTEKKKSWEERKNIHIFSVASEIFSYHLCMFIATLNLEEVVKACQRCERNVHVRVGSSLRDIICTVCNEYSSYSNTRVIC